jgi:hypothetical protein
LGRARKCLSRQQKSGYITPFVRRLGRSLIPK